MSSKQEVLEIINSTIVKNGEKGISAEVLNNVLTEMVESSGEGGSGDGALRLKMMDFMLAPEIFINEFSKDVFDEILPMMEAEMPGISNSDWAKAIYSCFEHNAKLYQQLMEKAQKAEGTFVLVDASDTTLGAYKIFGDMYGMDLSGANASTAMLGEVMVMTGAEAMLGEDVVNIRTNSSSVGNLDIYLRPDGGFTYELIMEDVEDDTDTLTYKDFYIPLEGATLTNQQKEDNISTAKKLKDIDFNVYGLKIALVSPDGSVSFNATGGFGFAHAYGDTCSFLVYIDGNLKNVQIRESTGEVSLYNITA